MQKNNGFSLIEILVVIAIIGILVTVAIPAYGEYRLRAVVADGMQKGEAYRKMALAYYNSNGQIPALNGLPDFPLSFSSGPIDRIENRGVIIDVYFNSQFPELDGRALIWDCKKQGKKIVYYCRTSTVGALAIPSEYMPQSCLTWGEFSAKSGVNCNTL